MHSNNMGLPLIALPPIDRKEVMELLVFLVTVAAMAATVVALKYFATANDRLALYWAVPSVPVLVWMFFVHSDDTVVDRTGRRIHGLPVSVDTRHTETWPLN